MKGLDTVKSWARELIDLLLVFLVLGVVVQIIFGADATFFGGIVDNTMALVKQLGDGGVVGLIVLLLIIGLYRSGRTA